MEWVNREPWMCPSLQAPPFPAYKVVNSTVLVSLDFPLFLPPDSWTSPQNHSQPLISGREKDT